MNAISEFLNTNGAKNQSAEEAILTICDRLNNSTLISDRRAAVLSLKAFSRQYRESVVAHGLRGLISTLATTSDDLETSKSVLKTLLILFVKTDSTIDNDDDLAFAIDFRDRNLRLAQDDTQITSIDQISLFVSDEILMNETIFETLTELLSSTSDFYVKLYILQIFELLVSTRPVRSKEKLLGSPLSLPVIISVLDELHEPIRNEAILLLTRLSVDNFNVQKLVAFENIFDKLFAIMDSEGALRGSLVIADCLDLLTELLRYNASNQDLFMETSCVPRLAGLVNQPLVDEDFFWNEQRIQNSTKTIGLVQLLVANNPKNQAKLAKGHLILILLQLAFTISTPNKVRTRALLGVADVIEQNSELQLEFSQIDVPYIDPSAPNNRKEAEIIPVIQSLLNWVLYCNSIHTFDVRISAEIVLSAYFESNAEAQLAFTEEQLLDYKNETSGPFRGNIFTTLLEYDSEWKLNPYKSWFACLLLRKIFTGNQQLKENIRSFTIGDESNGEELLTSTQALQEKLIDSLQHSDPRISIGYLMLLITWLFLDKVACNDFLREYSHLITIMSSISQVKTSTDFVVVDSLIVVMMGVVYDSTYLDSSITRKDLHALICKMIGQENYMLKIKAFKENRLLANADDNMFDYKIDGATGLPEVYFDNSFRKFFSEIFPRIAKLKDPVVEPIGVISFDTLNELETKNLELKKEIEDSGEILKAKITDIEALQEQIATLSRSLQDAEQSLQEITHSEQMAKDQVSSLEADLKTLTETHSNLESVSSKYYEELQSTSKEASSIEQRFKELESEHQQVREAKKKAEDGINKMSRELFQLTREKETLEKIVKKLETDAANAFKEQERKTAETDKQLKSKDSKISQLESANKELRETVKSQKEKASSSALQLDKQTKQIAELQSTNSQYIDKFRLSSKVIDEFKSENKELTKKLEELTTKSRNDMYAMKSKMEEFTSMNSNLQKSLDDSETTIRDLRKTCNELKANSAVAERKAQTASEALEKLEEEMSNLSKEKIELENELKLLSASHSSVNENHENAVKALENNIIKLRSEHTTEVQNLKLEVERLEAEKKSLEDDIANSSSASESAKKAMESRIAESKSRLSEVESTMKAAEQKYIERQTQLESEIKNLTATNGEHEKSFQNLSEKHTTLSETLSSLQKSFDSEQKRFADALSEWEAKLEKAHHEKDQLHQKHISATKEFELKQRNEQATAARLTSKIQSLQDEISTLSKEKSEAVEEAGVALDEKTNALNEEIEELLEQKDALEEEFNVYKAQQKKNFADLKEQKESVSQEKNSLSSTLEMISQKMNESDQKLTEARNEKKSLAGQLSDKTEELNKLKIKLDSEQVRLSNKIVSLEEEITSLKADLAGKSEELESERENLAKDSESVIQSYIEKINVLEADKRKAKDDMDKVKAEVETSMAAATASESTVSELNVTIKTLKAKIDSLTGEILEKSTSYEKVLEELQHQKKEFQNLTSEYKNKEAAWKEKESSLRDLNEAGKSKAGKTETEIAELKKKAKDLQKEVERLKVDLKKSQKSSDEREGELEKLRHRLSVVEEEKDKFDGERNATLAELSALKDAHEKELNKIISDVKSLTVQKDEASEATDKLKNELSKALSALKAAKEDCKKEAEKVKDFISSSSKETENLKDLNNKMSAEAENLKKKLQVLEQNNIELKQELEASTQNGKEEVQRVKTEYESEKAVLVNDADKARSKSEGELQAKLASLESKIVAMVPKSDLDDMFFLMKETTKEYKNRLRKLGEEVSSDEDDDGDDDDDEDDDESDESDDK